jgi:hypothetical protein
VGLAPAAGVAGVRRAAGARPGLSRRQLDQDLDGGWFPLVFGGSVYLLLTTWKRGRELLASGNPGASSISCQTKNVSDFFTNDAYIGTNTPLNPTLQNNGPNLAITSSAVISTFSGEQK